MPRALIGLTLIATLALSACGADGEPERPTRDEIPAAGISVTGSVSVGVAGSF
jgi:opacity protein-like surface antigen